MRTVEEIEAAISRLNPEELAVLRVWFAEFDADVWNRQFERDVAEGRLNQLAGDAIRSLRDHR
jgi:hypothetical protein